VRLRFLWCIVFLCYAAGAIAAGSSLENSRRDFDARLVAQLTARSPEAAAVFQKANANREQGDHVTARNLYARVHELVPGFSPALRRQGMEALFLDDRETAVTLCRQAVKLEASVDNLSALARALATASQEGPPAAGDAQEALTLARRAVALTPDDFYAQQSLVQAGIASGDSSVIERAADQMVRIAPDDMAGYYYRFLVQAEEGDYDAAEASLLAARRRGFPEAQYQSVLKSLRDSRPWYSRFVSPLAWTLGIWLGSLLLLLGVGAALSQAALRAAGRMPTAASGAAQGLDASLRHLYKAVLWLSCLYYWVSMPIIALLVLALGGGLIYGVFAIGHIPIKLVIMIVVVVGVTLASIVRGLFARHRDVDPGLRLAPDEEPRLASLLREVAGRIGTRPVDNVYLTPGTDLAVMERGGMLAQLRGGSERCLILGVGVLDGMKLGAFKAIMAHEYGHFSNRDTAGGGFALAVRRSLFTMAGHLAEGGAAAWYNPAWLFLLGFHKVFLRISQGASRLQEVLADRWAAFTYGAKSFEDGLTHVIRRSVLFDAHVAATMKEVVDAKLPLANLYAYQPAAAAVSAGDVETAFREALSREPSPYDSHPSPVDRFRWVRAICGNGAAAVEDREETEDVWSLFRDREDVEKRLTVQVRANVAANHGIFITG
jgi:Zn-dependent protease with chaperone function